MSEERTNPYQSPVAVDDELPPINAMLDGRLRTTGFGLRLIYWGLLLIFLGFILLLPASIFDVGISMQWVMIGMTLLGFLLLNVGPILCLTVPSGTGLRPWAIAAVMTQILVVAGMLLQGFMIGFPVASGAWLFLIVGGTVFLAFLTRVARAIERQDLVRRCRRIFMVGLFLIASAILIVAILITIGPVVPYLEFFPFGILVASLILVVAYGSLINAVSKAILNPPKQMESTVIP